MKMHTIKSRRFGAALLAAAALGAVLPQAAPAPVPTVTEQGPAKTTGGSSPASAPTSVLQTAAFLPRDFERFLRTKEPIWTGRLRDSGYTPRPASRRGGFRS